MALPLQKDHRYTYADYAQWPDEIRCELIDGCVYDMSPAPGTTHQTCLGRMFGFLFPKMKGHRCRLFLSPTDVVLSEFDVVQPDLFVVCDRNKITPKFIQGAPDVVVEFLSPSTTLKDRREKRSLYQKSGVREYITIHPIDRFAEYQILTEGKYGEPRLLGANETLILDSLGIEVPLSEVFEESAPSL